MNLVLEALRDLADLARWRVERAESELAAARIRQERIEALSREAETKTFGEMEKQREQSLFKCNEVSRLEIEFQILHKRWLKAGRKRERAVRDYRDAGGRALPSYRDMADLMRKPESAMAGLLHRAKKNFLKNWRREEEKAGLSRSL